jgi:ADP-ribose pyrophosphatase YjhB (NUDIX family)
VSEAVAGPRLAVRAVILDGGRLLVVNAYPGEESDLWCIPGGGAERGQSLADNLRREVAEETGLAIEPGRLLAVSEFHEPERGFHQVDLIYAARLAGMAGAAVLRDPAGVVNRLRWVGAGELAGLRFKPDCLARLAFGPEGPVLYDPLETLVR